MPFLNKVTHYAALALAINAALVQADDDFSAIIGGTNVPSGKYSFLTSLQTTGGSHFCGGSLIAPNVVLTAAHCVANGNTNFRVFLGNVDLRGSGTVVNPRRVYVHEQYNRNTIRNDIAIIALTSSVSGIAPINVDKTTTNAELNAGNLQYTIAGWGRTSGGGASPRIMQEVTLPVIPDDVCDNSSPFSQSLHDPSMVCIGRQNGSQSACNGDSGGPMFNAGTNEQIGLTSWGAQGCTSYAVYTQLPAFADWIDGKLALINGNSTPAPTPRPTDPNTTPEPTVPPTGGCKCVGSGEGLDTGETCGNWLNAGYNWCYSDSVCPGSTPSQRYPGYHWFRCNRSRLDQMIDYEMMMNNFPESTVPGYENFGAGQQQQQPLPQDNNQVSGTDSNMSMIAGVGIGALGVGLVSLGMFAYYKKQRDASIDEAIDRVEAERRVVSGSYKADV